MKIKWREHEAVLISIIAAVIICKYVYDMFRISEIGLNNFTGTMLLRAFTVILLWLSYRWVNKMIVPALFQGKKRFLTIALAGIQLFLIAYLIGPVINFASYYLSSQKQAETMEFPLAFGWHPQPFLNAFGGLGTALFILIIYMIYAATREIIIRHLEQGERNNTLRIVVFNEITLFLLRLFSLPTFVSIFFPLPDPIYYNLYFACLLPTHAVFLSNKFFLFPMKGERSFYDWQVMGPLTFFSFIYTVIFSLALGQYWSILSLALIWALQLFFVIPISWLDYKQEKEKILSLRGIEKALATSKADLQLLRMQINPHFLFNALNTIYGTALMESAPRTAESTQKLGDMMRFMIHENTKDFVELEKEVDYLRNYIDLQKTRIQDSPDIQIEDNIYIEDPDHQIVPMLLIPFVENAFKHGIDLTERSFIKIKLRVEAGKLNYEVSNSIHKLNPDDYEKGNSGIGLNSMEQRLRLFYSGAHDFSCGIQAETYVARLYLDLTTTKTNKKC